MMRLLRPTLAALLVSVFLTGCDSIFGAADRTPAGRVSFLVFPAEPRPDNFWLNVESEYQLVALDAWGAVVPGVLLDFEVREGQATVTPASAVTGADGAVTVSVRPTATGTLTFAASVRGRVVETGWTANVGTDPVISLGFDSLALQVNQTVVVDAQVSDAAGNVVPGALLTFTAHPAGRLAITEDENAPEVDRGSRALVRGLTPGEALLIATHRTGRADTATVVVRE